MNPDSEGDAGLLAAIGETLRRPGNSRPDVLADKLVEFGPRLAGTLTRAAQDPEAAASGSVTGKNWRSWPGGLDRYS